MLLPKEDVFFEDPEAVSGDVQRFRRARHERAGRVLVAASGGGKDLENGRLEIVENGAAAHGIDNDETNGFLHAAFTLLNDGAQLVPAAATAH